MTATREQSVMAAAALVPGDLVMVLLVRDEPGDGGPMETVGIRQLRRRVPVLGGLGIRAVKVFAGTSRRDPSRATGETVEYYAVCSDSDISQIVRHEWLCANVVPHLPITVTSRRWRWDTAHPDYAHVKPRAQIASEVQAFLAGQPEPEIWAYYSPYDTVVLCQLFRPMSELPSEIPAFTRDLMQEACRQDAVLPVQPPPVHYASATPGTNLRIAASIGLIDWKTHG